MRGSRFVLLALAGLGACKPAAPAAAPAPVPAAPSASPLADVQRDAARLEPLVTSPLARRFLAATALLPHIPTRRLYKSGAGGATKRYFTERQAATLTPADEISNAPP